MPFPDDPRGLIVGMAFGHTQYEDPSLLTYEQVSPNPDDLDDPGPVQGVVRIERGRIGDAPETAPTKITFGLRNIRDDGTRGEFSPRNVTGPRYGTLLPTTPTRVSVDVGDGPVTLATAFALPFQPTTDGPDIDPRVPVQALGMLNRISRDQEVRSAMSLSMSGSALLGAVRSWWSMEFGTESSPNLASSLAGGPPITAEGAVAGAATGPPGSAGGLTLSGGGVVRAVLDPDAGSSVWVFQVAAKLAGPVTGSVTVCQLMVGTRVLAELRVTDTPGSEVVLDLDDGTSTDSLTAAATADIDDGEWHNFGVGLEEVSPGTVFATIDVAGVGLPSEASAAGVVGIDLDYPEGMVLSPEGDLVAVCQAVLFNSSGESVYSAFNGNRGDTASTRAGGALFSAGIAGGTATFAGPTMGVQSPATVSSILRDAEDAGEGAFFEVRDGRALMTVVDERYNLDVALALDYEDVTDLLVGDDDRDQYNQISVSDPDGNVGTAEEPNGPVGSSITTGIGPRPYPASRSVYDPADLKHHAGWLLRKGTINKARYIVVLDLRSNQALIPEYLAAATGAATNDILGSRITIAGAPEEDHGPDVLDLIVEGEVMELAPDRWLVQLYCEPYEPWNVRELAEDTDPDSNAYVGRWAEEEGTALDEAIDEDDTSFDVDVAGGEWTQDPDEFDTDLGVGLFVEVGGEVMQVTGIAESGGVWTFTVVRSVNGVVKSHSSGAPLKVVNAMVWAL